MYCHQVIVMLMDVRFLNLGGFLLARSAAIRSLTFSSFVKDSLLCSNALSVSDCIKEPRL